MEKKQVMITYMDIGFKNFTSIHDRQAIEKKRCFEETGIPEWMTKEKTTLTPKRPSKSKRSLKQQTDNVLTDDEENTNGTNQKGYYSLVSRELFPMGHKRYRKDNKRNRSTINWWTLFQQEQNKM